MKYLLSLLLLIVLVKSQSAPKNLYYFSSTDIVFGVNPILHVLDLTSGDVIHTEAMTEYPSGTVMAAFNSPTQPESELILFGYKRLKGNGWELFLSNYNINSYNSSVISSLTIHTPIADLWDPSPSFGYDADLNAVFALFCVEGYMNITEYNFKSGEINYVYVPSPSGEPLNFQPSGAYDSNKKEYYINFYNQNSELEIFQFNVETSQSNDSHIYAHYPNYPMTEIFATNNQLYAAYNPNNAETLFFQVNQNNNTFTKLFQVTDSDGFGKTVYATNQNYITFVTHLSKLKILLTTLNIDTLKSTSTTVPVASIPQYPLPTPVAAII